MSFLEYRIKSQACLGLPTLARKRSIMSRMGVVCSTANFIAATVSSSETSFEEPSTMTMPSRRAATNRSMSWSLS